MRKVRTPLVYCVGDGSYESHDNHSLIEEDCEEKFGGWETRWEEQDGEDQRGIDEPAQRCSD